MKKILLRFFADLNVGDDLMVSQLLCSYPDWDFYAFGRDRLALTPFFAYRNFHVLEHGYLTTAFSRDKYDAYLLLGGSVLNYNCLTGLAYQCKEVLLCFLLRLKGTKNAVIGANLALPKNGSAKGAAVLLLKVRLSLLHLITVRDLHSFRSMEHFAAGKIRYFPDIVFCSTLPEEKKHIGPPKILGISVLGNMGPGGRTLSVCKRIAELTDFFLEESGKSAILFAFDTGSANDSHAILQIYQLLHHKDRAELFFYSGNKQRLLETMRSCDFILPLRFHACVLSLMLRIPILPLVYAGKTAQLLRDLHYEGPSFTLRDLDLESVWLQIQENIARGDGFRLNQEQLRSLHEAAQGHLAQLGTLFQATESRLIKKEEHAVGH